MSPLPRYLPSSNPIWTWLILASSLIAWPIYAQSNPCTVMPFDGSAENVLGVADGFVGEYCQRLDLTPVLSGPFADQCSNGGVYHVIAVTQGFTTTAVPTIQDVSMKVREMDPTTGRPEIGTRQVEGKEVGPPPAFPDLEKILFPPHEGVPQPVSRPGLVSDDPVLFSCSQYLGGLGLANPADVGPGPVHDIFAFFEGPGAEWERVQDFSGFENYRSISAGITLASIAALMDGSQAVPPTPSRAIGSVGIYDAGDGTFTISGFTQVTNSASFRVSLGTPGSMGVVLFEVPMPAAELETTYFPADPDLFREQLREGLIFAEVTTTAYPEGEIRGHFSQARITASRTPYRFELGLTHPGTPNCYTVHHCGAGDNLVTFDEREELLRPFCDGTQPVLDEQQLPPAGNTEGVIEFLLRSEGAQGPLFPDGYFEPGTGIPLVDGCIRIGAADGLDLNQDIQVTGVFAYGTDADSPSYTELLATLESVSGSSTLELQFEFGSGAGLGFQFAKVGVEFEFVQVFRSDFETGDTSEWTTTVP